MSRLSRSILLITSLAFSSGRLGAQQADKKWDTGWSAAVGADVFAMNRSTEPSVAYNFSGLLAREWYRRNSGLSWRTQMTVTRHPYVQRRVLNGQCLSCVITTQHTLAELGVNARYTFRRNSAIRPYIAGGPSLFADKVTYTLHGAVFGGDPNPSEVMWSLGVSTGVGLSFRLFRLDMFIEQRLLFPELSNLNARIGHPFTLGVRF